MRPAVRVPLARGPQQCAGRSRAGRWWRLIAVAVAVPLLAAGCGDDDEAAGDEQQPTSTPSTSTSTTSTTQPPGTDLAAVKPIVEDLLARDDEITDEIVRDPSVVLDPDAPILAELAEVVMRDEYDARVRTYRENAEAGLRFEPLNAQLTATTDLSGDLATIDEDTVQGPLCIVNTYRLLDGDGYLREVKDRLAHVGRVTAVRLDGVWKTQQIDIDESQVCDPGAVT